MQNDFASIMANQREREKETKRNKQSDRWKRNTRDINNRKQKKKEKERDGRDREREGGREKETERDRDRDRDRRKKDKNKCMIENLTKPSLTLSRIKFILIYQIYQIYKPKITLSYLMKVVAHWLILYHSVNGISYGLVQSVPIKLRPL